MLSGYVEKLKEHAKYARALLDYKVDDESLLSFEKGCIINILERGVDGWCLGEAQGKQGMFPVAMTEFILTDSSDFQLIPILPHSERRKMASGSTMRTGPTSISHPDDSKHSKKKKVRHARACSCRTCGHQLTTPSSIWVEGTEACANVAHPRVAAAGR
jgi:hypothetical protein